MATWKEMGPEERYEVVQMAMSGKMPLKDLCEAFGTSRQTLKKAMARAREATMKSLEPQSPGRKKELLVAQDEHARYKVNYKLVDGPATEDEVVAYLTEAFDRHGAPLVLKHDGAKIFHSGKVEKLLENHGVVSLTSPRYYPGYNGKMERSMRDLKQHIRAQRRYGVRSNLQGHIRTAMKGLNDKRPRPVLKGSTASEVFHRDRIALPDRWAFIEEVRQAENHFVAQAASREQEQTARRRAVEAVLLNHELLEISAPVTTDLSVGNLT